MLPDEKPAAVDEPPRPSGPIPSGRAWAFALAAGLLAGLLGWAFAENNLRFFIPTSHKVTAMGSTFDSVTREDQAAVDRKNATLALGVLGGLVGLGLGLAGGLTRGSLVSAATAGALGAAIGAVGASAASWGLLGIYFRQELATFEEFSRDLLLPTLVRGGIAAAIGAAAGIALGVGARAEGARVASSAVGGMIGGVLGAIAYELIGALLFPSDNSNRPTPDTWPPRLLAMLLISTVSAAGATLALITPTRRRPGRDVSPVESAPA